MTRPTAPLLILALLLAGCGGNFSDSGWNPLGWFGGGSGGTSDTLAPDGGFDQSDDQRPGIPQIATARWEPLQEGRLLVVTGNVPTKGYHDAALIPASAHPGGRMSPDPDGVLRLRFVAVPPLPDNPTAGMPANPAVDSITAALSLPNIVLARINAVEIAGASNVVSLRR
ncbi:hypothetical protein [Paracoccus sp. (in: a-proteobacteria)]|uniref:hypothetical protein n=1 Tax=Paracoccus sp. TaxID=267 RepID=UPI003A89C3E8